MTRKYQTNTDFYVFQGLEKLLKEKLFQDITFQEIAHVSSISRMALHRQFHDKTDLLYAYTGYVFQKESLSFANINEVIAYFASHKNFLTTILKNHAEGAIAKALIQNKESTSEYQNAYRLTGILTWWHETNQELSQEELFQMYTGESQ